MGKKPRSEKRQMSAQVSVRFDPELMARIEYAAAREGLSPASWLRLVAAAASGDDVDAMPRKPTPQTRQRPHLDVPPLELSRFIGELGRLGNNVNQISIAMNRANLAGRLDQSAIDRIRPSYEAVVAELTSIRKYIARRLG